MKVIVLGAGLLGAGLFGLLSGSGFFSGLASMAGIFGFLLQIALIGGAIWLALRFFRRRSEPQLATAGAPLARDTMQPQPGARMGAMAGGAGAATAAAVIGGIGVLYVFGIAGMSVMLDKTQPEAAFLTGAFLPGDVVKAVIAGLVTQSLSRMRPASLLSRA